MSWLQNLAKKGEDFLDQLDQSAGAAIEQAETKIQKIKEDNSIDRGGGASSNRASPLTMDRRLNTGMNRSMSDRHLANNSPIPDRYYFLFRIQRKTSKGQFFNFFYFCCLNLGNKKGQTDQ